MKGDHPPWQVEKGLVKEFAQSLEVRRGKRHRRNGDFMPSAQCGGIKVGDLFAKYLDVMRGWVLEECRERLKMGVTEMCGAPRKRMEL